MWLSQPSHRLRETGRGEVEQRNSTEGVKVVHVGVESSDKTRRREELSISRGRIVQQLCGKAGLVPVPVKHLRHAAYAKQRQGETGGQQRIDEARSGWQESPPRAGDGAAAEAEARHIGERLLRRRFGKLLPQCRNLLQ